MNWLKSIFKKKNYEDTRVECDINVEKATIEIFSIKTIVEDVMDDNLEIALEDALLENPEAKVGEDHKTLAPWFHSKGYETWCEVYRNPDIYKKILMEVLN